MLRDRLLPPPARCAPRARRRAARGNATPRRSSSPSCARRSSRLRAGEAALTERSARSRSSARRLRRGAPAAAAPAATARRAVDPDRPDLDVVRVSPSEGDGDADSDAARPVIRAVGDEGSDPAARKTGRRARRAEEGRRARLARRSRRRRRRPPGGQAMKSNDTPCRSAPSSSPRARRPRRWPSRRPAPAATPGRRRGAPPAPRAQRARRHRRPGARPRRPRRATRATSRRRGFDPDAHLPSSSHSVTDTSHSTRRLRHRSRRARATAPCTAAPTASSSARASYVPEGHTVRRGETLWEISSRYYQNPYQWPRALGATTRRSRTRTGSTRATASACAIDASRARRTGSRSGPPQRAARDRLPPRHGLGRRPEGRHVGRASWGARPTG